MKFQLRTGLIKKTWLPHNGIDHNHIYLKSFHQTVDIFLNISDNVFIFHLP